MLAEQATPHPDYPPRTARASGALQRRTSAPAAASVRTATDSAPYRKLHHAQPPSRPPSGTAPKQDSRTGRSDRQILILAPAISRWTTSVPASVIIDPAQCCPSLNSQRPTLAGSQSLGSGLTICHERVATAGMTVAGCSNRSAGRRLAGPASGPGQTPACGACCSSAPRLFQLASTSFPSRPCVSSSGPEEKISSLVLAAFPLPKRRLHRPSMAIGRPLAPRS